MAGTPEWLKQKIVAYYEETTEKSYLANWSGAALGLHYGLADETTASLDEAIVNNNRYVADALGVRAGMRVLDAGCGVGGTSIWMAQERGAKMVGVTLEPAQAALGARFAAERGMAERVELHVMDFMATTFEPASFDAAFNIESLCHCADLAGYFAHLRSLLRGGAPYGCMDLFVGDGAAELVAEVREGWSMPNWQSASVVVAALQEAGFEEVRLVDLTAQVRRTAAQVLATASNSQLVIKLDAALGRPASAVYQGHVRAAIACSRGLLEGGVTYGYVAARRPR
jgi:cyclopropane fatty-acyl-phospholipid synthase-like methyltransferase